MYNKSLDTFLAVAASGSFTKAADSLYISHTAVIKQISGLETHLGVRLFHRTNQGVTLTPAGEHLVGYARKMKRLSAKATAELRGLTQSSVSIIRIGTSLMYPCREFTALMERFPELSARCMFTYETIDDDSMRYAGLNTKYDILIGPYNAELAGKRYDFLPIGGYPFAFSMPRSHPLSTKQQLDFSDLNGQKLILMKRGTSALNDQVRDEIEARCHDLSIVETEPHYSLSTFNQVLIHQAMLLNLRCWENVHPSLVSIPLNVPQTLPFGIISHPDAAAFIKEFIAQLRRLLPENGTACAE